MEKLGSTSSKAVITKMKRVFASHGISQQVISETGTQYTSQEFWDFAKKKTMDLSKLPLVQNILSQIALLKTMME